jgi:Glycosyl hydrolase catalytic core
MTASAAAIRYPGHVSLVNNKWGGVQNVKMISPSPVNKYYPNCTTEPASGCAFQPQLAWLDEYFADCDCYDDMWVINLHDYNCNVEDSQSLVADLKAHFPGKNIFGELGCNGPSADDMAQ